MGQLLRLTSTTGVFGMRSGKWKSFALAKDERTPKRTNAPDLLIITILGAAYFAHTSHSALCGARARDLTHVPCPRPRPSAFPGLLSGQVV